MTPRARWVVGAGVAALVAATALVALLGRSAGGPSALSAGGDGWAGVRLYLEATGREVDVSGRPPGSAPPTEAVLVLTFPASRPLWPDQLAGLSAAVLAGRTLVIGYSGSAAGFPERMVLESLELANERIGDDPPKGLREWLAEQRRVNRLAGAAGGPTVEIGRIEWAPRPPEDAEVWYLDPSGAPLVFAVSRGRGRVLLLPAEVWSNARLRAAGNADLLEQTARQLGPSWTFDEWSHGLVERTEDELGPGRHAFDLLLLHLALTTVLGLWSLSRRFGRPWRRGTEREASVAEFLRDLGALHHRLGHHREAGSALVRRVREHDRRLVDLPDDPLVRNGRELMDLARAMARHQGRSGPPRPHQGDPR